MTKSKDSQRTGRRRGIQSVENGLRVLDALAGLGRAATLSAIARESGMPASQAHRYLASLMVAGMAQQDPSSGLYDLGPAALRLGLGALQRLDAFRITDVAITDFAQRTGRTVQIAALGPSGPTVVRWAVGKPPVMTSISIGSVLPLLHSATGQVFLAFAPEPQTDHLLEQELASGISSRAEADAIRASVRAAGFAHVEGTMIPGLRATAFPIFNLQGRAILTATALAPAQMPLDHESKTTRELGDLCRELSAQLGSPDTPAAGLP